MKNDKSDEKYCPHCKRHCELSNPRCGKGKALAKEIEKRKQKGKEKGKEKEEDAVKDDKKLLKLFKKYIKVDTDNEKIELVKPKKKVYIISVLAQKGEMLQSELQSYTDLSSKDIEKALHKLKKKGYINWSLDDKVSLTEMARNKWNRYLDEKKRKE